LGYRRHVRPPQRTSDEMFRARELKITSHASLRSIFLRRCSSRLSLIAVGIPLARVGTHPSNDTRYSLVILSNGFESVLFPPSHSLDSGVERLVGDGHADCVLVLGVFGVTVVEVAPPNSAALALSFSPREPNEALAFLAVQDLHSCFHLSSTRIRFRAWSSADGH
jgi:hypothetical protein